MRKRSKIRIPQTEKPWVRVRPLTKSGRSLIFQTPGKFLIWRTLNSRENRYFKALFFLKKNNNNNSLHQKNFISEFIRGVTDFTLYRKLTNVAKIDKKLKNNINTQKLQKELNKAEMGLFEKLNRYKDKKHEFSGLSKLRNFCLVQGKSRSYLRDFALNRHAIKKISRCSFYLNGFYR